MDDMNAFDRQLASVVLRRVGPSEPVDDLAIFESVTAVSRSPRRRFTVFSALRFVAAGVIVALFGGFLLAGVLTTQDGDEMAPAVATASPSPMTTDELLSGMVTEEVEPGVFRVVNDGVRDIEYQAGGYPGAMVDVTPDGGVWLSGDEGRHGLFRLGEEPVFEDRGGWPPYREVAPDGSLWATDWISDREGEDVGSGIFSFDGQGWTTRATTTDGLGSLAIGPDGTVWVSSGTAILRLEDDGSLSRFDHAGVHDGDIGEVVVSPDGDVWTPGGYQQTDVLLRFDGEEWEVIPGPEGFLNTAGGRSLGVGPDGTLWVHAGGLARFDDPGWTVFGKADGVKPWGTQGWIATDLLTVAPDGSLWLNGSPTDDGCGGVAHWYGTTWTSYLVDSCIHDLAVAPDGSAWLRAGPDTRVNTYVITPEAGATIDGSAVGAVAREPVPDPMAPSFFSGAVRSDETFASDHVEPVAKRRDDGVVEFIGESSMFALDANDPRISGMVTVITNETDYREGAPTLVPTGLVGTVRTGVMRIVNDEGSWEGEYMQLQFGEAHQPGYENSAGWLAGSGAYEGLSAYFVWPLFGSTFSGHITAEGLPPAPELPADE